MAAQASEVTARVARTNELIAYHSPISHRLTAERTSYQSQMIPVTPYILVACAETFTRYAEMMRIIDAAMPAEEIGRRGRRPGSQVNTVFLWSIANFYLLGRKIFTQFDPSMDQLDDTHTVLDFWDRAARGFRGDGTRQADDAGGVVRVYDDALIQQLVDAAVEVDDELRPRLKRFNATLVNFLFLHYFDTRVGTGDTGPYDLGDGRTLIVRDFYRMSQSDYWWSDVAAEVPFSTSLLDSCCATPRSASPTSARRTPPRRTISIVSSASRCSRPTPAGQMEPPTVSCVRFRSRQSTS